MAVFEFEDENSSTLIEKLTPLHHDALRSMGVTDPEDFESITLVYNPKDNRSAIFRPSTLSKKEDLVDVVTHFLALRLCDAEGSYGHGVYALAKQVLQRLSCGNGGQALLIVGQNDQPISIEILAAGPTDTVGLLARALERAKEFFLKPKSTVN